MRPRLKLGVTLDQVPEKWVRTNPEPDMDAIDAALAEGDPEAEAIAEMGERGTHIRLV
jgi:hypothetical protein